VRTISVTRPTRSVRVSRRQRRYGRLLDAAGLDRGRPYDLRHSFASLLFHEGRDVIYVARQLGHGAELTLRTYGHVIEELEDSPQLPAEDAIRQARERVSGGDMYPFVPPGRTARARHPAQMALV
jgi:integrase